MRFLTALFSVIAIVATIGSTPCLANSISTPGLQQSFDWQTTWGSVDFTSAGQDRGIPSTQLQPKNDIKTIITNNGTQNTDLTALAAYTADLNGDDKPDYILDGNGYFPRYQNPAGPLQICTDADGCYLSIYIRGEDTNLISAPAANAPSCPATAELNTACIASCASTEQNCPADFRYNTHTAFNERVVSWNIISADAFRTWAAGKSYTLYNSHPVLAALRDNTNCYNAEIAANNNQCIKYFQYFGDALTGTFIDLFSYSGNLNANGDYNPRWTYNSFAIRDAANGYSYTFDPNSRLTPPQPGDNLNYGTGYGLKLSRHGSIDLQFARFNFSNTIPNTTFGFDGTRGYPNKPNIASFHIENNSDHDYFVPVNTNREFSAFVDSHQAGVAVSPEQLQFTAWTGDLTCPAVTNAPLSIAAQRFCQSSTSDYRPCQACIEARVPGYEQGCTLTQNCPTNACVFSEGPADRWIGSAELRAYNGTSTTLEDCTASPPRGVWDVLYRSNGFGAANAVAEYGGCQGAFDHLCAQGNFCLGAETMISLPDGTTTTIDQIKAGDIVLGFIKPRQALKPYKVAKLAVTPNQAMISINGKLNLTPNHMVVNGRGHLVRASSLKLGDTLLAADKTKLVIQTIATTPATGTVYNLVLKGGAGFIADGVRVIDYAH